MHGQVTNNALNLLNSCIFCVASALSCWADRRNVRASSCISSRSYCVSQGTESSCSSTLFTAEYYEHAPKGAAADFMLVDLPTTDRCHVAAGPRIHTPWFGEWRRGSQCRQQGCTRRGIERPVQRVRARGIRKDFIRIRYYLCSGATTHSNLYSPSADFVTR